MKTLPGNPHAHAADDAEVPYDHYVIAQAALALAYEQHQRNRLAAITAAHRGIELPEDLAALVQEGTR